MTPSIGRMEPTWAKALVIDNGGELFCFVTIDAIGSCLGCLNRFMVSMHTLNALL